MLYLRKLESILLYLTIFSISIQLGKHFWPDFSLIQGLRVDYLSPTLFLSDIFILSFILIRILLGFNSFKGFISKRIILPGFLLSLLVSTLLSINFEASSYWIFKIVQMIFLGWALYSTNFDRKKTIRLFDVFIFAATIQSLISIVQFLLQRSIGGFLYFLGERSFHVDTIGIATFFSNGQELLRVYGTFPHPNVLAFFLSIALIILVSLITSTNHRIRTLLYSFLSIIIFLALLLTASRVTIISTLLLSLFLFIRSKKALYYAVIILLLVIPSYLLIFSGRFLILGSVFEAFSIRADLVLESMRVFANNLLFGVGPNGTFFISPNSILPIYVRFQPVHNIYLLIFAQIGLFGSFFVMQFLLKVLRRIKENFKTKNKFIFPISILVLELLIVGLFDHFFITLQQGLMMSSILLGLLFNKSMESA